MALALIQQLPERSRRVYGHDIALVISLEGLSTTVGLTLAGERVPIVAPGTKARVAPPHRAPVLQIEPSALLDWADGSISSEQLLKGSPVASRPAVTALDSAHRLLGGQVVPRVPELPAP